jgi:hypothetical protein
VRQHSVHYTEEATKSEAARLLQFGTTKSGFFALAQSRAADLPYTAWALAPALEEKAADSPLDVDQNEEGTVHFTLATPRAVVKIQVRGAVCQLLAPPIQGLHLVALSAGELLFALRDAGLNLMPLDGDARPPWRLKRAAVEAKVHADVAAVAGAFDVKSSRWNAMLGEARFKCAKRRSTRAATRRRSRTRWRSSRPTPSRSRTASRRGWAASRPRG